MMTEIAVSKLNKLEFFELIQSILRIASEKPSVANILVRPNEVFEELKKSFQKEKQNEETAKIVVFDENRDRAYQYLLKLFEAKLFNDREPEKIEAAKNLKDIAKDFGGAKLIHYEYNSESAGITNFIATCRKEQQQAIVTLGLEPDFKYLEKMNSIFIDAYKNRGDEAKEIGKVTPFRIVRKTMTLEFDKFCNSVVSMPNILPDTKDEIEDLIARLNVEFDKYQTILNRKNSKKDKDTRQDGEN